MSLQTKCTRVGCGGNINYEEEDGHLQGYCLLCSRPVFRLKVDRTPVAVAAAAEFSLLNERRRR